MIRGKFKCLLWWFSNKKTTIISQGKPVVHLSHRDFPHVGDWTILPLIPQLYDLHKDNSSWLVFVEDRTRIRLKKLHQVLQKYDPNKVMSLHEAKWRRASWETKVGSQSFDRFFRFSSKMVQWFLLKPQLKKHPSCL
jgi:hypothetical protein